MNKIIRSLAKMVWMVIEGLCALFFFYRFIMHYTFTSYFPANTINLMLALIFIVALFWQLMNPLKDLNDRVKEIEEERK